MGSPDGVDRLTPIDQAILQVCHLPADDARRAWDEELAAALVLEDLPTHDALPQLHRRLVELGIDTPHLAKLQGVRRQLFARNGKALVGVRTAMEALVDAGTAPVLTGDAAVLLGLLGHIDLRPLHAIDIIVSADGPAAAADAALRNRGWRPDAAWRDGVLLDVRARRYVGPDGDAVILRSSTADPYAGAASRATVASIAVGELTVASSTDSFLYTVLDGPRATSGAGIRWVSDALAAVHSPAGVDWDRIADVALARRSGPSAATAIDVLATVVPVGVPDTARARLEGSRSRWARIVDLDRAARPGVATALLRRARRGPSAS